MSDQTAYLRAILATVARQTFPVDQIVSIVTKGTGGEKQLRAYNLCDGSKSQSEIAKEVGVDSSNFSKSISRWVDEGIVIKVGDGRESKPIHVYPLPESKIKNGGKGE